MLAKWPPLVAEKFNIISKKPPVPSYYRYGYPSVNWQNYLTVFKQVAILYKKSFQIRHITASFFETQIAETPVQGPAIQNW